MQKLRYRGISLLRDPAKVNHYQSLHDKISEASYKNVEQRKSFCYGCIQLHVNCWSIDYSVRRLLVRWSVVSCLNKASRRTYLHDVKKKTYCESQWTMNIGLRILPERNLWKSIYLLLCQNEDGISFFNVHVYNGQRSGKENTSRQKNSFYHVSCK